MEKFRFLEKKSKVALLGNLWMNKHLIGNTLIE